ncbi:PREDICTED: cytochrome P450 71D9-like isoform X1 [Lupinus angustifolius]|uniref:cytochrome P450 71D9-like isoform X1 n=1 Tax=Lupinus angustifolius TaxID=3871 RepID=UPI00092E9AE6|nr:PREDICTED: cytochrome P450 71D9-like isoform X1 [Lupinus angustifolius]
MDLQSLYYTIFFSLFIFMYMTHKLVTKTNVSTLKLPPGPWKLPIIGNIHNLVGSLPHHRLRDLSAKYGPLMHLMLGEVSTIVVSSPDYAKEVLKTHDLIFASRPPILATNILGYDSQGLALAPYGDYWRQLRKICAMELLSSKRVQSFQPIRGEELAKLIKLIDSKEGSLINLSKEVTSTLSTIVSRTAFSRKCKNHQEFISVIKEATEVAGGFDLGDLYPSAKWLQHISGMKPKLEKLHHQADQIMQNIINEHREVKSRTIEGQHEEAEEDLLDVLLKFKNTNNLTDDQIKAVILDIFGGGFETSATTVVWTMAEIIRNPRVMWKTQVEVREVFDKEGKSNKSILEKLEYLKSVVKETLRLHPPGTLLVPRECKQACEIKGYNIPFKSKIIIHALTIGRNPKYWTDPERFTTSSFDYKETNFEYIPFGAGRRMCPGITFGLIDVELPLALLLYHFDWKLPIGMKNEEFDMTETFGSVVTRKDDLYLIPTIYHP